MNDDFAQNADFLLRNLMDSLSDAIYFKDRESRFIAINKACLLKHGWTSEAEVAGKTDFDIFTREHAEQAFADERRIIETGEPLIGAEEKETWPDGSITWVSTSKMPLRNEKGEIIGTFGVSRDITEHKLAELRAAEYAEQIRQIKEDMEDDVRMAAELQKTFFPHHYPSFPSDAPPEKNAIDFHHLYHTSGLVSGDFCSVMRLSNNKCGIFLCDVMGHGVRAALGTALIYAIAEDLAPQESDPGRFLERMNEMLLPVLRQDDTFLFATACYAVFDAFTGLLRFANAGHPDPLLFRAAGNEAEWLMNDPALRGPALAMIERIECPTTARQLEAGDLLAMYTDGLYEVLGADGSEFGESRLMSAANALHGNDPRTTFSGLVDAARKHSISDTFDDDVCLVGFQWRHALT